MFNVVLVCPEIPSNTGNIGRLCAAANSTLHLVGPLGFSLDDKYLKRAGLDYWNHLNLETYSNYLDWQKSVQSGNSFFFSAKAQKNFYDFQFKRGDFFVFGSETKGLGFEILKENQERCFKIPMPGQVRSLNLSNAVSIVVYEAFRQFQQSR